MTERLACDVSDCPRPADLVVIFYGQTREWPYCSHHALNRDGTFRWKGKVQGVRSITDSEASWVEQTTP